MRNRDNTISVFATDVDPAVKEGSLAATSRVYAIGAHEIFGVDKVVWYNAGLEKQLAPEMQLKIQNYGIPISN